MSSQCFFGNLIGMDAPVRELSDVFAENFSRYREDLGVTLDHVAKASREFGARWTASRVKDLESGRMSVTLPNLCAAAWTLSSLGQSIEVGVVDLLATDDHDELVRVGELTVRASAVRAVVVGERTRLDPVDTSGPVIAAVNEPGPIEGEFGEGVSRAQIFDALRSIGLVDQRAAKRLGVDVNVLSGAAIRRWGRILSSEVDRVAGEDASPQQKGHITRRLISELEGDLRDANY